MTAREYLRQAYRLDHRINSDIEEAARLRELATSLQSPGFEEHYGSNRPTDAPFVRHVERLVDLEKQINDEVDALVDLKREMHKAIGALPNLNERMVLRYRYIHNMTWRQIANKLHASNATVRRWHSDALNNIVVPENEIFQKVEQE